MFACFFLKNKMLLIDSFISVETWHLGPCSYWPVIQQAVPPATFFFWFFWFLCSKFRQEISEKNVCFWTRQTYKQVRHNYFTHRVPGLLLTRQCNKPSKSSSQYRLPNVSFTTWANVWYWRSFREKMYSPLEREKVDRFVLHSYYKAVQSIKLLIVLWYYMLEKCTLTASHRTKVGWQHNAAEDVSRVKSDVYKGGPGLSFHSEI